MQLFIIKMIPEKIYVTQMKTEKVMSIIVRSIVVSTLFLLSYFTNFSLKPVLSTNGTIFCGRRDNDFINISKTNGKHRKKLQLNRIRARNLTKALKAGR